MVNTGLSAFIALCITTEICDQRSTRSWDSFAASRSASCPEAVWNRTLPAVMMPGARSSRVIA